MSDIGDEDFVGLKHVDKEGAEELGGGYWLEWAGHGKVQTEGAYCCMGGTVMISVEE